MKSDYFLKKNSDYQRVYRTGKSYANKYLVMYIVKKDDGHGRFGISVSKKVGNSVVRHRVTRLIRESYRLNRHRFLDDLDIVIVARASAKDKDFRKIESALLHLGKIHNILKESK